MTDDPVIRVCLKCGKKNGTPLLLCPLCQARERLERERRSFAQRDR